MPRIAVLVLLALAACAHSNAGDGADAAGPDPNGWRLASGKPPTGAEFAAVVASCQEMGKSGPLDGCLNDLGLRRAP